MSTFLSKLVLTVTNHILQNYYLYADILAGAEFFHTEDDYLTDSKLSSQTNKVKTEVVQGNVPSSASQYDESSTSSSRKRKRPRRSANVIRSYAVPDSEDEAMYDNAEPEKKKNGHLQMWIKHLGELLKREQAKVRYFLSPRDTLADYRIASREEEEAGERGGSHC